VIRRQRRPRLNIARRVKARLLNADVIGVKCDEAALREKIFVSPIDIVGNLLGLFPVPRADGLELLDEVVPRLNSVTVLRNPHNPASTFQFREVSAAGQRLNRQLCRLMFRPTRN
jgi:hypothetical protein